MPPTAAEQGASSTGGVQAETASHVQHTCVVDDEPAPHLALWAQLGEGGVDSGHCAFADLQTGCRGSGLSDRPPKERACMQRATHLRHWHSWGGRQARGLPACARFILPPALAPGCQHLMSTAPRDPPSSTDALLCTAEERPAVPRVAELTLKGRPHREHRTALPSHTPAHRSQLILAAHVSGCQS